MRKDRLTKHRPIYFKDINYILMRIVRQTKTFQGYNLDHTFQNHDC